MTSNLGMFIKFAFLSDPDKVKNFKLGANFSISFSQLKTTDVGQITRVGSLPSFSFAFCSKVKV